MIVYVILLVLVLFLVYTRYRSEDITIKKNTLSKSECNTLINVANKYHFDTYLEPVDNDPVFQIDINVEGKILNEELWEMCKKIQKKHMGHIKRPVSFVFLKRYKPEERTRLYIHFDTSTYTSSFLLSDTSEFEGGELYIFDKKKSRELEDTHRFGKMPKEDVDKFVNTYPNLPKADYAQGDMISYNGTKHLHGILPVTKGSRYVLSFFFAWAKSKPESA